MDSKELIKVSYRQSFTEHLPSIHTRKITHSQNPKIVTAGALTRATPVNEEKNYRRVSDIIGNNYSPNAKNLNAKLIYESTKRDPLFEEKFEFKSGTKHFELSESFAIFKHNQNNFSLPNIRPQKLSHSSLGLHPIRTPRLDKQRISLNFKENLNKRSQSQSGNRINYQESTFFDDSTVLSVEFPPWYYSTHGLSRPSSPLDDNIPRYLHLINNCIKINNISPLDQTWLNNMLHRIAKPELVRKYKAYLKDFCTDIHENYMWSLKKAITDYVLIDREEESRLGIKLKRKQSGSAGRFKYPWHSSIINSRSFLSTNLFSINRILQKILHLFYTKYENFRLFDLNLIVSMMPLTIQDFRIQIQTSVEQSSKVLKTEWLRECAKIIEDDYELIEEFMRNFDTIHRLDKMDHLFGCISALMSRLLRSIVENTLNEFIAFLENYSNGNSYTGIYDIFSGLGLPKIKNCLRVFLHPNKRLFSTICMPGLDEIHQFFDALVEIVIKSVDTIPSVESLLFQQVDGLAPKLLRTLKLNEEFTLKLKERLHKMVDTNSFGCPLYQKTYDAYNYLLSNQCDDDIEKFLRKERSLEEFRTKIDHLKELIAKIVVMPINVPMNLFLIDCSIINQVF